MRYGILLLAACLFAGMTTTACTITSDVENILDLPEVTPEVQASFESAVSTVTEQVLDAAMESIDDVTAPAAAPALSKQSLRTLATAQAGQTVTINKTVTKEDGGTITVTGTITGSGTDASGSMDFNLKAEWTNLGVSDGTTTQKSTGSETITGKMTWTSLDTDAGTLDVNLTLKGSFTLGSENYAFNIVMTLDGDTMAYSGTVNGNSVSGNVPAGATTDTGITCTMPGQSATCGIDPNTMQEVCTTYDYNFCIAFTDPSWTSTEVKTHCGSAPIKPACSTSGLIGTCTQLKNGKEYVYYSYDVNDISQADCIADGGSWVGNN